MGHRQSRRVAQLSMSSTSSSASIEFPRFYEKSYSETSEAEMTSTNFFGESSTEAVQLSTTGSAETLSSGATEITETEPSSISTNDTSYGLVSLISENDEDCEEFLQVPAEDVNYLLAVRHYMSHEPVYRPKKPKLKVVRRLQFVSTRCSYTHLRREVRRRQPRPRAPIIIEEDETDSTWLEMLTIGEKADDNSS